MKKFTSIFNALLLMGTVLFYACKKEEAVVVTDNCSTASAKLAVQGEAYTTAFETYKASPNTANCNAVKVSLSNIIATSESCPAYASQAAMYKPLLALYTCQ